MLASTYEAPLLGSAVGVLRHRLGMSYVRVLFVAETRGGR